MERSGAVVVVLAGVALALYVSQSAEAGFAPGEPYGGGYVPPDPAPGDDYEPEDFYEDPAPVVDADARLAALKSVIKQFESNNDYTIITGGQHFQTFADHPRVKVWFHDPRRPGAGLNNWSDAAGAYQMISSTFDRYARRIGVSDFSPASQDLVASAILADLGVPALLNAGNVQGAILRASSVWASLPGSTAMQNPQTLQATLDAFSGYLPT